MKRMKCTRCGKYFEVLTGCSSCAYPPGPVSCPTCGKPLCHEGPAYFYSEDYDEE